MSRLTLYQLYTKMLSAMGPQGWWPADSKFEIILGAILVQNTKLDFIMKLATWLTYKKRHVNFMLY